MASSTTTPAEQGFGCMGFSAFYTKSADVDEQRCISVFRAAVEAGVTLFNTACFYGPLHEEGYGANLRLLRKCLEGIDRSRVRLMVKIGLDTRAPVSAPGTKFDHCGDEASLRADVDYALRELGVDYIDVIVLCRVDPKVPVEESVRAMQALVTEGKARAIGLSEASAAQLRRAHAVAPIWGIEQEWSLWTRDIEQELVPTCRELGIRIIAYSPLGRGFLTGAIRSTASLDPTDYRVHGQPRFADGNMERNLRLVEATQALASARGCTAGQLALAWLHAQGAVPIPGTTSLHHLEENLAARNISLSSSEVQQLNDLFAPENVAGDRYSHMAMTFHGASS